MRLDERPEISVSRDSGMGGPHEGALGGRTGLSGGLGSIKWEQEMRLHGRNRLK